MGVFDGLRAALRSKVSSSLELAKALDEAERVSVSTAAYLTTLQAQRTDKLIGNDAERAAYRRDLAAAQEDAEDAAAFVSQLTERLAASREAEAQARKSAVYADAKAKADAAGAALVKTYPKLGEQLAALAKQVAAANEAVALANADLPEGVEPLADPEAVVRDTPAIPPEIVRTRDVDLWVYAGSGDVLSDEAQQQVEAVKGSREGRLPIGASVSGGQPVVRQRFRRIEQHPAQPARSGERLAKLELPGLRAGDPALISARFYGESGVSSSDAPAASREVETVYEPIDAPA